VEKITNLFECVYLFVSQNNVSHVCDSERAARRHGAAHMGDVNKRFGGEKKWRKSFYRVVWLGCEGTAGLFDEIF